MKKTVEEIIDIMQEYSSAGFPTVLSADDGKGILSELSRLQSENDELRKRLNDK